MKQSELKVKLASLKRTVRLKMPDSIIYSKGNCRLNFQPFLFFFSKS